jgi:hypothetical protein
MLTPNFLFLGEHRLCDGSPLWWFNFASLLTLYVEALTSTVMEFGDGSFWRCHKDDALVMRVTPLKEERFSPSLPSPMHALRRDHMKTEQEAAIDKPGRVPSPETDTAGTWSWTSQPPELWENNFCCWSTWSTVFCFWWPQQTEPPSPQVQVGLPQMGSLLPLLGSVYARLHHCQLVLPCWLYWS